MRTYLKEGRSWLGPANLDVTIIEQLEERQLEEQRLAEQRLEPTLDSPIKPADLPPPAPGQMLGRYELLSKVGQGGMGAVYMARDPHLGRTVAIKLLHSGIDDQRLEREARGLAKVSHPNVIAVYDVGRARGRLFLAMEFVQGLTLRRWLAYEKRSRAEILNVFLQAGRGLEAAHAAGLVHRDFKPDNVLVGDDGRVRVLDFGLVDGVAQSAEPAQLVSPQSPVFDENSSAGSRLTAHGSLLGTPAYMALEQYSGATEPRTNQYSYCVVLWEALYGRRPFDFPSVVELLARLRSGPPPEAPRDSDVPLWLERLLRRGLSRQLEARFASMSELLGLLESSLTSTRAREALVGFRYRPLLTSGDEVIPAIDTFTDQQVVLKATQRPQDFELLASLEHPNLVPVLDAAESSADGSHYLVFDLAQPRKAFHEAAQGAPLAIQLEWLCELLRALHYLHRREVGYAPLTAQDVLVIGGHVRLLISEVAPFEAVRAPTRDLSLVGALARALPAPSAALSAFARSLVDASRTATEASAASALEGLGRAAERTFVLETAETREGFLRAMPLLGRAESMAALGEALERLAAGTGSAFFVEGESGVGKSRLLEQLRRAAVGRGVCVLEGRGEASAQGPYRVFRLPLLRLALRAGSEALDDFELEALAPLVPELPVRLGRALKKHSPGAEPAREALQSVVLAMICRERQPLLLLLEDLQWAGSESFALLSELVALSETRRS
ncbi:MAG: protein kinase [Polyangiaceae bacterium]